MSGNGVRSRSGIASWMSGALERHRLLGRREHGQVVVLDLDELAGGGRRVLVDRDNGRHRLAAEAHAVDREQRPVGDHGAVMGLDLRADQVAADEHPHDARAPQRAALTSSRSMTP